MIKLDRRLNINSKKNISEAQCIVLKVKCHDSMFLIKIKEDQTISRIFSPKAKNPPTNSTKNMSKDLFKTIPTTSTAKEDSKWTTNTNAT